MSLEEVVFDQGELFLGGRPVELSPREKKVVGYFWENEGVLLSRESFRFLFRGYGDNYINGVMTYVSRIRKLIESGDEPSYVRAVMDRGYIFTRDGRDVTLGLENIPGISLRPEVLTFYRDGEKLPTTRTEFDLLSVLYENAEKILSPREIARQMPEERQWALFDDTYLNQTVRVHVRRIRMYLELDSSHPRYLVNRFGMGYVLYPRGLLDAPQQKGMAGTEPGGLAISGHLQQPL